MFWSIKGNKTDTAIKFYGKERQDMTDKKHALMMMMFTRQRQYIQMLLNILDREGITKGDDVTAFDYAVINDPASFSSFQRTDEQYRLFAASIRLELPRLPPSPESEVLP